MSLALSFLRSVNNNIEMMSSGYALLRHGTRRGYRAAGALSRVRYVATSSTSQDAANLPLAGIRVLDMTRVLAGVSSFPA